jgi:recombination protein RecA
VKVIKNKLAPPFRTCEFDIMYGEGISKNGEIVDLAAELGIFEKSGAWYGYAGTKIAQGREAAKQFLQDNPEVADEVEIKIKAELLGFETPEEDEKGSGTKTTKKKTTRKAKTATEDDEDAETSDDE